MIDTPFLREFEAKCFLKGQQNLLLDVLRERFGAVPEDVTMAIRGVEEDDQFVRLVRIAARCESLDQFRDVLGSEAVHVLIDLT
jgi:hypothetical protein